MSLVHSSLLLDNKENQENIIINKGFQGKTKSLQVSNGQNSKINIQQKKGLVLETRKHLANVTNTNMRNDTKQEGSLKKSVPNKIKIAQEDSIETAHKLKLTRGQKAAPFVIPDVDIPNDWGLSISKAMVATTIGRPLDESYDRDDMHLDQVAAMEFDIGEDNFDFNFDL